MKTISILSGKGGVGKSSITASLALYLSKKHKIMCVDCDVDASNLSIVLGNQKFDSMVGISTNKKAVFDLEKCNSCMRCLNECYFNAIEWVSNKPRLKDFSCEGCSYCELICPQNAITLKEVENAELGFLNSKYGFKLFFANLKPGESGSGKIVSLLKQKAKEQVTNEEFLLIDSAAGIGCPVISSINDSNYAIVVAEPSAFGYNDMLRAIDILNHFKIKYSIIINKFDISKKYSDKIQVFAKENNITILTKIPFNKIFVDSLVNLTPIIEYDSSFQKYFDEIYEGLMKEL
jgi:MinD superfamily P-loop ATPase